jgi:phage tail-like protein
MPATAARNDPFVAFRFEVRINGMSPAGFSECTGLQATTEFQDYPEGGLNSYVHKLPTRTKQGTLILKRGIVNTELWEWYYRLTQGQVERRDGSIWVYDPAGQQVVMEWQFLEALPTRWQGADLNASQNNVAVETLELIYHRLKRLK